MFDLKHFLEDLKTFVAFKTVVCDNQEAFKKARAWIKAFFDPEKTAFIEMEYGGLMSWLIKPKDSTQPHILGDGHIGVFDALEGVGVFYRSGV